jgi:membrane protein YdbS with pleckstrin-like domain
MFCEKCGGENSETAKFCRKCGAGIGEEVETRVTVRNAGPAARRPMEEMPPNYRAPIDAPPPKAMSADVEKPIFSITPTLLFVKVGYVIAALAAVLLVAAVAAYTSLPVWIAIVIGLMLFLIPGYFHFKQKLVRYTLTESQLEIDEGFIARKTRNIPLSRIQDVTVSSSVVQRVLGFGDLMIDNASDEGGRIALRNINTPKVRADQLLKEMRKSAKEGV